jgi:Transposase DDE domain.
MTMNSSIQRTLDKFYGAMNQSDFNIREVTKGAFTQARSKLNPECFKRLNKRAVEAFYKYNKVYTWYGHRLLAVDGSRLMLPNHKTVREEFGVHGFGPNADSDRSLALCSMLYDVMNLLTVDSEIAPYSSSERELFYHHLEYTMEDDLILMDRGYPSIGLFFLLQAKGLHFCARMKESWWKEIDKFGKSGEKESIVSFRLPGKGHKLLNDYPKWQDKDLKCRLVRVELPNGESEILCTSLTDMEKYPHEDFCELYHYRWNEEEGYKLFKCRVEVEDFSGKTAVAVKQDFYAKIFLMTLAAAYAFPIEEKVREEYKADKERKYDQKINRTNALSMTRNILIGVFLRKQFQKAIKAFDDNVSKTREIIRPGRSVDRKQKPKKLYCMNYKRL